MSNRVYGTNLKVPNTHKRLYMVISRGVPVSLNGQFFISNSKSQADRFARVMGRMHGLDYQTVRIILPKSEEIEAELLRLGKHS